jgi:CBS domain-containing protein
MLACDIMSHPVVSVRPWTPVAECAALLVDPGFSAVPVLDDDDRLIGIVTEADPLRWPPLAADSRRQPIRPTGPRRRPPEHVAEVMTATVESLTRGLMEPTLPGSWSTSASGACPLSTAPRSSASSPVETCCNGLSSHLTH